MSNEYVIFVDGGCDIDTALIKSGYVNVLPTRYKIDGKISEYDVASEADIQKFYTNLRNGSVMDTTDITAEDLEEYIGQRLRHGVGVLYIAISSKLSSAYEEGIKFKNYIKRVCPNAPFEVIDSRSISGSIGIIAEQAVYNKQAGMSLDGNVNNLKNFIKSVKSWHFIDDTEYLRSSGKITSSEIFITSLLKIKPIFEIAEDGDFRLIDKKFGTKKACEILYELFLKTNVSKDSTIYINHSDDINNAMIVKSKLEKAGVPNIIKIMSLTPLVGAHCGPGVISIHFAID